MRQILKDTIILCQGLYGEKSGVKRTLVFLNTLNNFWGRAYKLKPDGWKNKNHKAKYSDHMAELIENQKAKYFFQFVN